MAHAGGRPPKYKNVEEIKDKIEQYFKSCEGEPLLDADGNPMLDKWQQPIIVGKKPLTVTGLALALGFSTRQGLLDYQGKKEFSDTITRAKSRVEEYAESRLFDREGQRGAEFNLRNNFKGWNGERERELDDMKKLDEIIRNIDKVAINSGETEVQQETD